MYRYAFILLGALLLGACGGKPSTGEMRQQYQLTQLPGLLELSSFQVESPRNIGSDDSPVWLARYTAEVAVREDTYELDEVLQGRRLLKPVRAASETFKLYGTVRSQRAGKGWSHHFQSDGSSNPLLGRPLADYGPEALVAGSPEAVALQREAEQAREQQRIAEETARAQEAAELRQKEEAEAARRKLLEDAVARHKAAFAPGRMADLNLQEGVKVALLVTASSSGPGKVWGTDRYTGDSDFAKSVLHAGLLKDGETGIVEATSTDTWNFLGSPRNGVDSQNYTGRSARSYTLRLLERIGTAAPGEAAP